MALVRFWRAHAALPTPASRPPSLPRPAFFYAAFALQVAIEVIRGRVAVYDYCFCDDVITIIIVPRLTAHTGHRPAKFQATTG